jgi:hypothetical protein
LLASAHCDWHSGSEAKLKLQCTCTTCATVQRLNSDATYLAWTSMTTRAPHVVRCSFVRLPRTRLTSFASSWLHLHAQQHGIHKNVHTHNHAQQLLKPPPTNDAHIQPSWGSVTAGRTALACHSSHADYVPWAAQCLPLSILAQALGSTTLDSLCDLSCPEHLYDNSGEQTHVHHNTTLRQHMPP